MLKICYSVNYVNRNLDQFINLLKKYQINCIIDIREHHDIEQIYSSFKREGIKKNLNNSGIYYIDMNREFSLKNGEYSFDDIVVNSDYKKGIERIISGIDKGYKIGLLCEENITKNYSKSSFVAYGLKKNDVYVENIIDEEHVKSQKEIEETFMNVYKIKLIKKVAELSISNIMNNIDLDMDESDFKAEMLEESYEINYNLLLEAL